MNCARASKLLADYLAGLLLEPQAKTLEEHLATCQSCQALFLPEDTELDALLATDWYAAEPPVDLVPQVMSLLPTRGSTAWIKVTAILLAWSCYFAFWLVGAATLGYSNLYQGICSLVLRARASLQFLLSIARSLGNALSLLAPTTFGISLLLVLLATLLYCLYRLEKEENLI